MVYDALGQEVATLFDGVAEPGRFYSVRFGGTGLSSGVYFYRLNAGTQVDMKRMVLDEVVRAESGITSADSNAGPSYTFQMARRSLFSITLTACYFTRIIFRSSTNGALPFTGWACRR